MGIQIYRDRDGARDFVGRIEYEHFGSGGFTYDPGYLEHALPAGELGVSHLLPLDVIEYSAEEFGPFFKGLLPEGEIIGNLAELYQIPRTDYLGMLERMGCESIGALTFVSDDVSPAEYEPHYDSIAPTIFDEMVSNPARMATLAASSTRLSLAGAQSKVAWFLPDDVDIECAAREDWLIPKGTAPATHIIKISRKGEEEIALNELACSLLAKACGIEVAKVYLLGEVPGAIAVERYDRKRESDGNSEKVLRLHQEDFCQALGFAPFYKYQPQGVNVNYPGMVIDLLESASSNPQVDKVEYAKRLVFCYAIGNTDAHLKNFSLLYNQAWTGCRLAPMYDITCIPLTGYSTAMPFDVGEHRNLDDIDVPDLLLLASDLDVGLQAFDGLVSEVVSSLEVPRFGIASDQAQAMVDRILDNASKRMAVLKRFLGM